MSAYLERNFRYAHMLLSWKRQNNLEILPRKCFCKPGQNKSSFWGRKYHQRRPLKLKMVSASPEWVQIRISAIDQFQDKLANAIQLFSKTHSQVLLWKDICHGSCLRGSPTAVFVICEEQPRGSLQAKAISTSKSSDPLNKTLQGCTPKQYR